MGRDFDRTIGTETIEYAGRDFVIADLARFVEWARVREGVDLHRIAPEALRVLAEAYWDEREGD